MNRPTLRFASRVENYIKYRPGYPRDVVTTLAKECGLTNQSIISDIGSGTGILSELFLKHGNRMFGVEPNREMREAGARLLKKHTRFTSIDATAEGTTLADHSIDFVTAGQAFHWFDRQPARKEFARILKPDGWVVLIWNDRQSDSTPFLQAYEQLLVDYATDYAAVNHKQIDNNAIGAFFAPGPFVLRQFDSRQVFDFEGLKGRLLSSSYTPEPGHPNYQAMVDTLRALFDKYQANGKVAFEYVTLLYYGRLVRQFKP